jgi:hypothetical protein
MEGKLEDHKNIVQPVSGLGTGPSGLYVQLFSSHTVVQKLMLMHNVLTWAVTGRNQIIIKVIFVE